MAQLGSFSRAMQPQLRVASCASAVILSIQCVNLHFISQLQVLFFILALFLLIFKIKSPILRFFIVNDVTLQQISEIKSKIV